MINRVILFLCALILFSQTVHAQDAILEWDENSDADYYVVYWSTDSGSFTEENSMEIPADMTFLELKDSDGGQEYYYSVKAFNACGNASDFSDTVKTAHIPRSDSFGKEVDTNTAVSLIMGAQANGGGCFIGNAH